MKVLNLDPGYNHSATFLFKLRANEIKLPVPDDSAFQGTRSLRG